MIVLLVHGTHGSTHKPLVGAGRFDLRITPYHRALRASRLPRATYLFSDLDRLDHWELELAGRLHRLLAGAGVKALNDPARVRLRYGLLRELKDKGLNDFDVWRVDDGRLPQRYPVFLRRERAHRGPLSDLLHDESEARAAVKTALAEGVPAHELILIEYRAEPVREGLFRKLGMHRVGDRLVETLCGHDTSWLVKRGKLGIAGQNLYDDELDIVTTDRHARELWPAFEAAEIEYGRADFGIVEGRVQVYEINTNPTVRRLTSHPFPVRVRAERIAFRKLAEAFEAIDTNAGPRIRIDDEILARQRRRDRWVLRAPWRP